MSATLDFQARELADRIVAEAVVNVIGDLNTSGKSDILAHHDAMRGHLASLYLAALKRLLSRVGIETLRKIKLGRHVIAQAKMSVVAHAATTPAKADFPFDLSNFSKMFFAEMRSAGAEALQQSGQGMAAELGLDPDQFITSHGIARQFLITRENKLDGVPQEIYDTLKASLAEGTNAGETEKQLGQRVQSVLGDIESGRAQTIARTETASAYGAGRLDAIRQAGLTYKSWLTADDPLVRPSHQACEDQGPIPVDDAFANGLDHPGDPDGPPEEVINCRCVLQAEEDPNA